jgi:hypothetical protein
MYVSVVDYRSRLKTFANAISKQSSGTITKTTVVGVRPPNTDSSITTNRDVPLLAIAMMRIISISFE